MGEGLTFTLYETYGELTQAEAYGQELVALAAEHPEIVVLTADVAKSTKTKIFLEAYPERTFNFGIAEQNMMSAAAGLALAGFLPFVSTFAPFASMRACEQVRTDIAYPNLKVRIVATHAGLSMGAGGTTHHATEDIAIMRALANMTVIVPADALETVNAVRASLDWPGPVYIRIGRGFEPMAYDTGDYGFQIGQAVTMHEGNDATVIACGVCVLAAKEAAEMLADEGYGVRVLNMHTVKPIDRAAILQAAAETPFIVTAEEHNIIGGLGGAVAEVLAEAGAGVKLTRLGLPDEYSELGYPEELLAHYSLDMMGIYTRLQELLTA